MARPYIPILRKEIAKEMGIDWVDLRTKKHGRQYDEKGINGLSRKTYIDIRLRFDCESENSNF